MYNKINTFQENWLVDKPVNVIRRTLKIFENLFNLSYVHWKNVLQDYCSIDINASLAKPEFQKSVHTHTNLPVVTDA